MTARSCVEGPYTDQVKVVLVRQGPQALVRQHRDWTPTGPVRLNPPRPPPLQRLLSGHLLEPATRDNYVDTHRQQRPPWRALSRSLGRIGAAPFSSARQGPQRRSARSTSASDARTLCSDSPSPWSTGARRTLPAPCSGSPSPWRGPGPQQRSPWRTRQGRSGDQREARARRTLGRSARAARPVVRIRERARRTKPPHG